MIPLSVLDLVPINAGSSPGQALRDSLELARAAERLGYRRFWVAEHHNMPGIASAATSVVIGHLAGGTSTIRIGAGGIMLPNHAPMVIAEQFGTLEALYPGRIDLGLGRAPGSDGLTQRALRRDPMAAQTFPQDVQELQAFLAPEQPGQPIRAVPGVGAQVPIWILGSSTFGAQLAAFLGLPYGFASHFAPDDLLPALEIYRETFKPSEQLATPYAMPGLNVIVADTDEEAQRLFTSLQQAFGAIRRGRPAPFPPPVDRIAGLLSPSELTQASQMLRYAVIGSPETVRDGLQAFVDLTAADELMVASAIYDQTARLRSYELLAQVAREVIGPAERSSEAA
jgi:luciferase family oxidoreductase group 1